MSGGFGCEDPKNHRPFWRVHMRRHNRSAFNGYRRTPSDYSGLLCLAPDCRGAWRTKAAYVDQVPDITDDERQTRRVSP